MEEGCNEKLYTDSLTDANLDLTMPLTHIFSMLDQHIRGKPNHFKFYFLCSSGVSIIYCEMSS